MKNLALTWIMILFLLLGACGGGEGDSASTDNSGNVYGSNAAGTTSSQLGNEMLLGLPIVPPNCPRIAISYGVPALVQKAFDTPMRNMRASKSSSCVNPSAQFLRSLFEWMISVYCE